MITDLLQLAVGFILISFAADRFIIGASGLSQRFGISPLVIGLTVVAIGTSAPEIFVSIQAAIQGNTTLAVGNVLGSNIANIGLVLAVAALIRPLSVNSITLKREYPILFFVMIVTWLLLRDQYLNETDGVILFVLLGLFIAWLILTSLQNPKEPMAQEFKAEIGKKRPLGMILFWLLFGSILLLVSSHFIVKSAVSIAEFFSNQ